MGNNIQKHITHKNKKELPGKGNPQHKRNILAISVPMISSEKKYPWNARKSIIFTQPFQPKLVKYNTSPKFNHVGFLPRTSKREEYFEKYYPENRRKNIRRSPMQSPFL